MLEDAHNVDTIIFDTGTITTGNAVLSNGVDFGDSRWWTRFKGGCPVGNTRDVSL